jgi:hypothetical protein
MGRGCHAHQCQIKRDDPEKPLACGWAIDSIAHKDLLDFKNCMTEIF